MQLFIYLSLLFTICYGGEFRVKNNCPFTVWARTLGNQGHYNPEGGRFVLTTGASHNFNINQGWAGRIWADTLCQPDGSQCKTGGWGTATTLGEWNLAAKTGDMDWYDISLVDGYNVGMCITLIPGTFDKQGQDRYNCGEPVCIEDMLANCPGELAVKDDDKTIACMSACAKFKTEAYCCTGAHAPRDKCVREYWPVDYPSIFKHYCPDAYSWAYDDASSMYACIGKPYTGYEVTFCPK
ncbi:unnamed protein product [Oppiella nova]|uniref:Thaumatin-like protein n=1 Tax=Oppiella nova TaxID=334625 RepID=A0A7R9LHB5_9ACAR|nr:unnamed protein product [Oppiella nova]CAG2163542.1 unnamed protein product [Oppiella nova]